MFSPVELKASATLETARLQTRAIREGITVQEAYEKYGTNFVPAEEDRDALGQPVVNQTMFQTLLRGQLDEETGIVTRTLTPAERRFFRTFMPIRPCDETHKDKPVGWCSQYPANG